MPDAIAALRQAIEVVRAQIPKGELTLASVQRLLETAEMVCQGQERIGPVPPSPRQPTRQSTKRLEERRKWARIAKEAEREARPFPPLLQPLGRLPRWLPGRRRNRTNSLL